MKKIVIAAVLAAVAVGGYFWLSPSPATQESELGGEIIVPQFSALAAEGEEVYNGTCAACHGVNLAGTDNGPTFLQTIYRPAHHSDYAFVSAVQNGVIAHHWNFGNMPKLDYITNDELVRVISYIREMQQANGIL